MSTQTEIINNNLSEVRKIQASQLMEKLDGLMGEEKVKVVVIYKDESQGRGMSGMSGMSGDEFLEVVEDIVEERNVSRVIIYKANGEVLLEMSLGAGLVVTVLGTIFFPKVLGVGVIGALLAKLKLEVVGKEKDKE